MLLFDFCKVKKAIGYRIRKLRESRDYNQENMGAELGITPGAYAKIERGETDPSATRLLQIADILKVDVSIFFHDNNLRPASRVEQPVQTYSSNAKTELDAVMELIKKMNKDFEKMRKELDGLKKEVRKK